MPATGLRVDATNNTKISSLYDFGLQPNIHDVLFKRYGKNTAVRMLRSMGREFPVSANMPFKAHEEDRIHSTFTVFGDTSAASGAGDSVTVTVNPDEVDGNGNVYPRENQVVYYKHTDGKVYELQITSKDETSVSASVNGPGDQDLTYNLTLTPLDGDLTIGAISDGTEFSLGGLKYGEDTGQPAGTATGIFEREFYDVISKETSKFTGVALANQKWYEIQEGGYSSWWSEAYAKTEFLLDLEEDLHLFLGQVNSNNITQTDTDANSVKVRSGKGWWKWMDELAYKLNYEADGFDIFYLDEIRNYLETQQVSTDLAMFFMGSGLYNKVENAGLDFVQSYSSGTDLTKVKETMFGGDGDNLGVNFGSFTKNGITYVCQNLDIFNDPTTLGNPQYDFNDSGMIIPYEQMQDPVNGQILDNLGVGYVSHNEVNRRRLIEIQNGMSGFQGAPSLNQYDNVKLYMLSHLVPFMIGANRTVQVKPA